MTSAPGATLAGVEAIPLARTTVDDYGRAAMTARSNQFWWYMNGLVGPRPRRPLRAPDGRWWWRVKPGFAWPVDFFTPIADDRKVRPGRRLLGWQYPVQESRADSRVRLNVIHDLAGYDLDRIDNKKRRHSIRKALRELTITIADLSDVRLAEEGCEVWDSHVRRTGWNRPMSVQSFRTSWSELARWPGTTLLTARRRADGVLCAWLIARVIDETVFIDTLTSHSDRLESCPNDGLVFLCLYSAARMGVRRAHYALKSRVESLEAFKQALGFSPHPFPARLVLRPGLALLLRTLRPAIHKRLLGDESWGQS